MEKHPIVTLCLMILVAVLALIFGPMINIWALNALFPALEIPTTVATWGAMLIVNLMFYSLRVRKGD